MLKSIFNQKPKPALKPKQFGQNRSFKYFVNGKYQPKSATEFKVFKPNPQKLFREQIKAKVATKTNLKLNKLDNFFKIFAKPSFDFKLASLNPRNLVKNLQNLVSNNQLGNKLAKLSLIWLFWLMVLSILYLSFFDTHYLVKNYQISFAANSYLSPQEVAKITQAFETKKLFLAIPNNQYWFLNETNLTLLAQSEVAEVNKVKILKQIYPNSVSLEIQTEPILATLGINQSDGTKFWRVSDSGKIITQDDSQIKQNLINVEKSVLFNKNGVSFKDYSLQDDQVQLNRLWFTKFLWDFFATQNLPILATNFFSITDTDVTLITNQNTKLLFDSNVQNISKEVVQSRLNVLVNTTLIDTLNKGELAYIDLRIPSSKLFLCYKNADCAKTS